MVRNTFEVEKCLKCSGKPLITMNPTKEELVQTHRENSSKSVHQIVKFTIKFPWYFDMSPLEKLHPKGSA